jgi:hypothetical protein
LASADDNRAKYDGNGWRDNGYCDGDRESIHFSLTLYRGLFSSSARR